MSGTCGTEIGPVKTLWDQAVSSCWTPRSTWTPRGTLCLSRQTIRKKNQRKHRRQLNRSHLLTSTLMGYHKSKHPNSLGALPSKPGSWQLRPTNSSFGNISNWTVQADFEEIDTMPFNELKFQSVLLVVGRTRRRGASVPRQAQRERHTAASASRQV